MIKVLSIAGSDPSSGAGIQIDIKTFQALGAFGMAIPAALTVQNSRGVSGVYPVSHNILSEQLVTLFGDIKPDAVKTGMLFSKQNVEAVSAVVRKFDQESCDRSGAQVKLGENVAPTRSTGFAQE